MQRCIRKTANHFDSFDQQDSHDFLMYLLESIDIDLDKGNKHSTDFKEITENYHKMEESIRVK